MEYKVSTSGLWEIRIEKHMESKGFFRNATGPSKVGEICLVNQTNEWFIDFLTENDEIYYMELGCVKNPKISIGDKENNVSAEERIKFLYEALSSNENYNCLAIRHKDKRRGRKKLLFEIDKWQQKTDIVTFSIDDL